MRYSGGIALGLMASFIGLFPAQSQYVQDYSDIATLESSDLGATPPPHLNIRQYSTSDPSGGGEFILDSSTCGLEDHGVFIHDTHPLSPNCYRRQFSGPVHMSWYGTMDASKSPCLGNPTYTGCDSTTKLNKAFAAAQRLLRTTPDLGADGGVVTDGRPIVIEGLVHILSYGYLSCGGPPGGGQPQITQSGTNAVPYYTLPNSIFLNPADAIVRDAHSLLTSCIIEPDWYYNAYQQVLADRTTRSLIDNIEHAFAGTATRCGTSSAAANSNQDGTACNMERMLILGFDVCDDTRASAHAVLSDLKFECNVGEFIHNNGGGTTLASAAVENFIEGTMDKADGTDFSRSEPEITSIAQDGSEVQIKTTTPYDIANGDTVLISGLQDGYGPIGQNARWIAECTGTPTCGGTFDLKGSSWTGPSYANSFWKAGTNVIG
jgi:hypothetical protein